jgi:hypothetical protein
MRLASPIGQREHRVEIVRGKGVVKRLEDLRLRSELRDLLPPSAIKRHVYPVTAT